MLSSDNKWCACCSWWCQHGDCWCGVSLLHGCGKTRTRTLVQGRCGPYAKSRDDTRHTVAAAAAVAMVLRTVVTHIATTLTVHQMALLRPAPCQLHWLMHGPLWRITPTCARHMRGISASTDILSCAPPRPPGGSFAGCCLGRTTSEAPASPSARGRAAWMPWTGLKCWSACISGAGAGACAWRTEAAGTGCAVLLRRCGAPGATAGCRRVPTGSNAVASVCIETSPEIASGLCLQEQYKLQCLC